VHWHLGVRAAVNGQGRSGDVLGLGARQERHSVGDVVRTAIPAWFAVTSFGPSSHANAFVNAASVEFDAAYTPRTGAGTRSAK